LRRRHSSASRLRRTNGAKRPAANSASIPCATGLKARALRARHASRETAGNNDLLNDYKFTTKKIYALKYKFFNDYAKRQKINTIQIYYRQEAFLPHTCGVRMSIKRNCCMIQEFSIENTFSIKTRQTISFEATDNTDDRRCINVGGNKLLKLAAIYGANASGKSNVIKAFDFYMDFILNSFASLKPRETIPFTPFLFDDKTKKGIGSFEIIFYIDELKFIYQISLDSHLVHKESLFCVHGDKSALVFVRTADLNSINDTNVDYQWAWGDALSGDVKDIIKKATRANASFLNTAAQFQQTEILVVYQYFLETLMPSVYPVNQGLIINTVELIETSKSNKNSVISLLRKADIGSISDITIEREPVKDIANKSSIKIRLSHDYGDNFSLPLSKESRGTQRLFELAAPLLHIINENKFLCIDEIDSCLHEDLLNFFIETFINNSKKSQLFFTTHNQDLLDSNLLVDDEVWFVEKNKSGGSELFSLLEFEDVPEGVSRRGLYKAGAFGAKPCITSYVKD
jgi:AAA15 family ATPase/GTPase